MITYESCFTTLRPEHFLTPFLVPPVFALHIDYLIELGPVLTSSLMARHRNALRSSHANGQNGWSPQGKTLTCCY